MTLRPTPETDANIWASISGCIRGQHGEPIERCYVQADFARNLERERDEARERVAFLNHAIAKRNQEIEQTFGKALGYPWFKDDQKNFPGATEEHGVCVGEHVAETIVSELAGAYKKAITQRDDLLSALVGVMEDWEGGYRPEDAGTTMATARAACIALIETKRREGK